MLNAPNALLQGGTHPRPQLVRDRWTDLCGTWEFARDRHGSATLATVDFAEHIIVPFAPESPASGIAESGFCDAVWYRRQITVDDLRMAGFSEECPRVLLHLGAVDHRATVWVDGQLRGEHVGGQTPFFVEIDSASTTDSQRTWDVVVRAERPSGDLDLPRGKQDWHEHPHAIWYHRRTGIWQPVWLEAVPVVAVSRITIVPKLQDARLELEIELGGVSCDEVEVVVEARFEDALIGAAIVSASGRCISVSVPVQALENGQARDELTWSPDHPRLVSVAVRVRATVPGNTPREVIDTIGSYTGIRSVGIDQDAFLLNGQPCYIRAVLEQGYWPESHYTAPSAAALREEVEAILRLGFNTARLHQKAEDPRFLFWADRLGLMIWGETANAYRFSARAVSLLTAEWTDLVRRDMSHPSIITWVPINESWGVQDVRTSPRQQAYARGLADLTRALDGTRPVLSNDGWEHTDSDMWTIHDYHQDPEYFRANYASREQLLAMLERGPDNRAIAAGGAQDRRQPFLLTEFGGIKLADAGDTRSWGWTVVADEEAMAARLSEFIAAVRSSSALAGFCYTQLTDTEQEMNGLLDGDRRPKGDESRLRAAITHL